MKQNRSVRAIILTSIVSILPALAFAAGETQAAQLKSSFLNVGSVINSFTTNIVTAIATLFATAAMVAFFYGIVQYIWGLRNGKPEEVAKGNKFMIWGLVALFVMFSVWGIIMFFQNIFGIQGNNTIVVPKVQIDGASSIPTNNIGGLGNPGNSFYCSADGKVYIDKASFDAGCGKTTSIGGQTTGGATQDSPAGFCAGKDVGTPCTVSGRQGACDINENSGDMACNACPAGQVPGATVGATSAGCVVPNIP